MKNRPDYTLITATADMHTATHGNRAKCLQRLVRLGLPVPLTATLSFDAVRQFGHGVVPDLAPLWADFSLHCFVSVGCNSQASDWGGASTVPISGMKVETAEHFG